MRRDVHLAALKAATKVAFAAALVGCGGAEKSVTDDALASTGDDSYASEADLKGGKPKKPKAHVPAAGGCHEDAGKPLTCQELVDAAFPTVGNYPGAKQDVSAEVAQCCNDLLESKDPGMGGGAGEHRWDCCANAAHPDQVGMACTPWGPPVPPSMIRRRVNRLLGVA